MTIESVGVREAEKSEIDAFLSSGEGERRTLLVSIEGLRKDVIAGENHDDGKILVHKGEHTVLQLSRHHGFAVEVGDLLDLEGAYVEKISKSER